MTIMLLGKIASQGPIKTKAMLVKKMPAAIMYCWLQRLAILFSKIEVKNLFLIGAFESVFSLFRAKAPLLPSFLIRYRFDTALHVSVVEAKSYLLSSKDDEIVPIENFYNLKKRIKNLVEYKELTSYNHDEILFSQETQDLVKRVLH